MTLLDLTLKIKDLKRQQKEMVIKMLDGRSQKWLSDNAKITTSRLNSCLNSTFDFKESEITKINNACNR